MESIKSLEEHQTEMEAQLAEKQAKMEAIKARLPEVSEFVVKTLNEYKSGEICDLLKETASGLKYVVHEEGTGDLVSMSAV